MTPCASSLRFAPSLALLLGLAAGTAGCIDPKSIGQETDDDGSGSAESGSDDESSGGNSSGQTTSQTTGQTDGPDTDPTMGESSDTGDTLCPPIDIPACVTCECIDGDWACDSSACVYDCDGLACGEACMMCPAEDPECTAPEYEGVCTADGQCVGTPPPKLGFCEGALQPGFEGELDVVSGCADVVVFAHDAADERGLVVYIDQGLAAAAIASGEPVHAELPATDPTVMLEGRAGFSVTAAECNDVVVREVDIKENWLPTAGTVIIDVVPLGPDQAEATVELVDVALHRVQPGPAPIVVNMTFSDVFVGWLPG
jgi:hypothetical protein